MRVLVAGIGHTMFADDGFGPAVCAELAGQPLGAEITVADFGTRSLDLAFALADGVDAAVMVDALPPAGNAGRLRVLVPSSLPDASRPDGHALPPDRVVALARQMGRGPAVGAVVILGCEAASLDFGTGLSPAVHAAVPRAAELARELSARLAAGEALDA